MGKCQSKKKDPLPHMKAEFERALNQCMDEKQEYKEKYEDYNRRYEGVKSKLENSLTTIKTLQKQLKLSEDNATALYHRYAIESDLNKRLARSQKSEECRQRDILTWNLMGNTTLTDDIRERMDDFEGRLLHMELILANVNF